MKRYYKSIQITLTEEEYRAVQKVTAFFVNETGIPVSVTKYAKGVLMEEVKKYKHTEETK